MKKMLLVFVSVFCLVFCSCGKTQLESRRRWWMTSDQMEDARVEQIMESLQSGDKVALKSLFSEKALSEASAIDDEIDAMFQFLEGEVLSWEKDLGAQDQSINYGKTTWLLRYPINIQTDRDEYILFVFDYCVDTMDPSNEGVYMIEISRKSYSGTWKSWQERMRAGIDIVE